MPQIFKDFVFNVQSMLLWWHDYADTGEWTANKNCNTHRERVEDLLPQVLELIKDQGFDDRCG